MASPTLAQLLDKMFTGSEVALARLMTLVERDGEAVGPILEAIAPQLGNAFTLGITGPPGGGKSSLVDCLAALMRKAGKTVGIRFLIETGDLGHRRKARRREELLARVEYEVRRRLTAKAGTDPALRRLIGEVSEGKLDPHTASDKILNSEFLKNGA